MTISISAGPVESGAMGSSTSVNITCAAGDTLVVGLLYMSATITVSSMTCSGESNLTLGSHLGPVGPDNTNIRWGYLSNVTTGGSKTVTVNLSGSVAGSGVFFAIALASGDTAGAFDTEGTGTGTGTTASASLTTNAANSAILGLVAHTGADPTAGSGYTLIPLTNRHWNNGGEYDLDVGAAGAKTPDMAAASSGTWAFSAIAIKAAGSGSQALEGAATGGAAASGELAGTKPLEGAATAAATASGDLGRQFRFTLYDVDGSTPLANKTGLWWAWWDVLADVRSTAPDASGTGATTDASGVFSVVAPSALTPGDNQGFGIISDQDATPDATEAAYVGSFDVV